MLRPEDRIGKRLCGKYEIEGLLAHGGMGLVYAATHQATGRAVAVKFTRPELALRPDLVRRVAAEARLAVEAAHPNVVQVLDAGADEDNFPYLVLERLYGQTLEALLDQPLGLLATAQAIIPVMNALVALHRAGIVHRDIKPSNLFLSQTELGVTPKLLDFGIAKALAGSTSTVSGSTLGTPAYMAPEQALGSSAVGPASDTWSIAVMMVRCLTGKLPFDGAIGCRLGALQQGLSLADVPSISQPIASVLLHALRLDPSERHASMAQFRGELLKSFACVDGHIRWPDESTIGYAPGVCSLPVTTALPLAKVPGTNCSAPVPSGFTEVLHGPALGDVTRTLADQSAAARAHPAPRVNRLSFAVAGLAASVLIVAALAGATRFGARHPASKQPVSSAVDDNVASTIPLARVERQELDAPDFGAEVARTGTPLMLPDSALERQEPDPPVATSSESTGREGMPARSKKMMPPQRRLAAKKDVGRESSTPAPSPPQDSSSAAAMLARPASPSPAALADSLVGANRSPIIE